MPVVPILSMFSNSTVWTHTSFIARLPLLLVRIENRNSSEKILQLACDIFYWAWHIKRFNQLQRYITKLPKHNDCKHRILAYLGSVCYLGDARRLDVMEAVQLRANPGSL